MGDLGKILLYIWNCMIWKISGREMCIYQFQDITGFENCMNGMALDGTLDKDRYGIHVALFGYIKKPGIDGEVV